MPFDSLQYEKVRQYLKKRAPYSVVDLGFEFALEGHVHECGKSGNRIHGIVVDKAEVEYSVFLDIISGKEVEARCACCSEDDMEEQWCSHAVALALRSYDLDFFDPSSGFATYESSYRMNMSSPTEIASVIAEIREMEAAPTASLSYQPQVKILLDLRSDRLGVSLLFDGEAQGPTIFGGFRRHSQRALDNVLLQILEDEGNWDEDRSIWYINSSKGIEIVLGLIQEYDCAVCLLEGDQVHFSRQLLEAKLTIEWLESAAELVMHWVLPDSLMVKQGELLGTGPYWAVIDNTIHKLSPAAARIASVFPYHSTITLPKGQAGPILEVVQTMAGHSNAIEVRNPELQPTCEVKDPAPLLDVQHKESYPEHFSSTQHFELIGYLDFEYPTPPEEENIVYLPNREKEKEYSDFLMSLGFNYVPEKKYFASTDDPALDIVYRGPDLFPTPWKLTGLNAVRKTLRFAELSLDVSISATSNISNTKKSSYGIDWFDCHISLVQNNANVPLSTLFKNLRADKDRWIRLDSGAFAQVPGGGLKQLQTTLGMLEPNFKLSNAIKTRINPAQAIHLSHMKDDRFSINSDRKLKTLARKLQDFDSIAPVKVDKLFTGKLRPYQADGFSWLNFLNEFSLHGILADEMGLGKTVQTLAILQHLKTARAKSGTVHKPTLIVAPTSVIMNWIYEAKRFTPHLKAILLHGPQRRELFVRDEECDIAVTSYALLRLDRHELERVEWGHVVLDEAQNIKNPQAATTRAAKSLQAERRLALTGTPTENRPMELWSIFDFLMPGYLGSYDFFRTHIEKPILEVGLHVKAAEVLKHKTKPFILRRLKAEVERDLPPKIESVLHVPMTAAQRQVYSHILEEVRPRVFDAVSKKGIRGASISILAALLRLRQVCNHPRSIEAMQDLEDADSGKFNLMQELLLEALASGRKVLLFSQFLAMLSIIRNWLDKQGVNYLYLDGATKNRQDLVEQFNNDPKVRLFLISLKAGGTGVNLTGADTVVIYDPWWNPAVEGQAVDRAHRIGQTKKVSVYRLVTEDSIEQKIMELKGKKAAIVDALINENGLSTLRLTKNDLEFFFSPLNPA